MSFQEQPAQKQYDRYLNTITNPELPQLPPGYQYAKSVELAAVAALFTCHYPSDVGTAQLRTELMEMATGGINRADIAIQKYGELIGFGRLAYNDKGGNLSELVVKWQHRRKGIGRAIIAARTQLADQLEVEPLYVHRLTDSNHLASYYVELGFHEAGHSGLVRRHK